MSRARIAIVAGLILAAAGLAWWTLFERAGVEPSIGQEEPGPAVAAPAPAKLEDEDPAGKERERPKLRRNPFAKKGGDKGEPVTVEGRVVDEKRQPVAGATVSLRVPELVAADAVSNAEGRYRLEVKAPEDIEPSDAGGLVAHDREGRVGFTRLYLVGADAGAGEGPTIEMRAAGSLEVRVIDEHGGIGGAKVIAWAGPDEGVGETGVRVAETGTNAEGKAEVVGLPFDAIALLAIAPDGRRARAGTRVTGANPPPVTIEFEERREYTLHVTAGRPFGAAVGAKVLVARGNASASFIDPGGSLLFYDPPIEPAPTNAAGETRLIGLPPGDTPILRVVLADGTIHIPSVRAEWDSWEVAVLGPREACDWQVVSGASPVPPDGSPILLGLASYQRPMDLPKARMSGTALHVEGLPRTVRECIARAPDGSVALLRVRESDGETEPVSFHPVFHVVVHLVEDGVGPLAGAGLLLRDDNGHELSAVVETDAAGKAVLESPYEFNFDVSPVWVAMTAGYPDAIDLAQLSPAHPEAPIKATVARERTATLKLLVDGSPSFPPSLEWSWWDMSHVKVEEAPGEGTIVVRYRASLDEKALPRLVLTAPGFHKATASLPRVGDDPKSSQDVSFERTGALHVRVKKAKGAPLVLELERREDGADLPAQDGRESLPGVAASWKLLYRPAPVESGEVFSYDPVEPGLYRMRDATSGVVTAPFEVFSKGGATETSIDLSDLVRVRGRVEVKSGASSHVRILVSGFGIDFYDGFMPGKGVAADGTFDLWLPAGREPSIRATHMGLTGKEESGSVTISGPKSDIVLTLGN